MRIRVFGVKTGMENLGFCEKACLSCARCAKSRVGSRETRVEKAIWCGDSRVKLVFDVVFACTTLGRGGQRFNAEDAEGEEETEERGRMGSRRASEDQRRKGEEGRAVVVVGLM